MRAFFFQPFVVFVLIVGLCLGGCGQGEEAPPDTPGDIAVAEPVVATESEPVEPPAAVAAATPAVTGTELPPLPIEEVYIVETLPADYPESWVVVQDAAFFHMMDGRIFILDAAADTIPEQVKGMMSVSFIANVTQATTRPEIYSVETFYSRLTRGERTDAVTIWDRATLSAIDEVVLPGNKRFQGMPPRYAVTLIANETLLLVFNFSPAASVTVIDVEAREIVNEIQTPGCILMYPTGTHGFTGLCSNGGLLTTVVDDEGQLVSQTRHDQFFDTDNAPISERAAIVDGVAYFPGFHGEIWPIDLNGETAVVGEMWSLVSEEEAAANWRPGGTTFIDKDDLGRLYIIMHPDGAEGTQQGGGPEVWIFDAATQQRVQRVELNTWGISVGVTRGDNPLMVTTNAEMALDVYDGLTGEYQRTITGFGQETPFVVTGAR